MTQMVKFPSIEQFRNIVKVVRDNVKYHQIPTPTLTFEGTVKLHGTNASVLTDGKETWTQSRERIITPEDDNAGFSMFAYANKEIFADLLAVARGVINNQEGVLGIYGEWCGGNIQKGIGINGLPKMFVVFGISIGTELEKRWFTPLQTLQVFNIAGIDRLNNAKIYGIRQFPTWTMDIDFVNPEMAQNKLVELTLAVEDECPVAKQLGAIGIGEGIVWTCVQGGQPFQTQDLRFKVKGEKHSASKVTKLAEVDVEKVANVKAFVEYAVTENRLKQMKEKMGELGQDANDVKNMGTFLKLIGGDVIKEELDTLAASGLDKKDVMGAINRTARDWFVANIEV